MGRDHLEPGVLRADDAQRGAEDAGRAGRSASSPADPSGRAPVGARSYQRPATYSPIPSASSAAATALHDEVGRPRRRAAPPRRPDRTRVGGTRRAGDPPSGRARTAPRRRPACPLVPRPPAARPPGGGRRRCTESPHPAPRRARPSRPGRAPATRCARARPGPRTAPVGGRDRSSSTSPVAARVVGVQQGDRLRTGGQVRVVPHQRVDPLRLDGLVPADAAVGEGVEADVGDHAVMDLRAPAHPVDVERPDRLLVGRRGDVGATSVLRLDARVDHRRYCAIGPLLPDHAGLEPGGCTPVIRCRRWWSRRRRGRRGGLRARPAGRPTPTLRRRSSRGPRRRRGRPGSPCARR